MNSLFFFFFSSRRRHTRCLSDWSSDVCSSDLSSNYWVDVVFSGTGGGSGTQSGQLTASPTSLSFGNVLVGTKSAAQTITLKNSGTASLSISQVNVTGSGFAASGGAKPLTLETGQHAPRTVI